jgi:hypothetical protein
MAAFDKRARNGCAEAGGSASDKYDHVRIPVEMLLVRLQKGGFRAAPERARKRDSVLPLLRRGKLSRSFFQFAFEVGLATQIPLPVGNFSAWAILRWHLGEIRTRSPLERCCLGSACLRGFPAVAYSQAAH